jgi:hypothetical protein
MSLPLPNTKYIWELGIDWDLIPSPANTSYMPGGFLQKDNQTVKRPHVKPGDQTITFRIFDLKIATPRVIEKIESFTINPQVAIITDINTANANINPFDILQPEFQGPFLGVHSYFFGGSLPCWQSETVTVTADPPSGSHQKYLLNFFVQLTGNLPVPFILRTFAHDPEMIVGEHG